MSRADKSTGKKKKVLLLGKDGQVGQALTQIMDSGFELVACGRKQLDLTDTYKLKELIKATNPAVIINAAAYNHVDGAEDDRDRAMQVNAEAPGVMAEVSSQVGALFVHYSTDFVFDGEKSSPYKEDDQPNPINYYGVTKLAGEEAVKSAGGRFLILRTSWLYGFTGKNFLLTMLKLAREKEIIRVVNDQFGVTNWSWSVAEFTSEIIDKTVQPHKEQDGIGFESGIFHLSALGETTWYDFAKNIFSMIPDPERTMKELLPIPSEQFKTAARRPKYSVLNSEKVTQKFGLDIKHWEKYLELSSAREGRYKEQ